MAEKLSRDEWKGEIHKAASDAAKAYVKFVKFNSEFPPADGLEEKVTGDMEAFLSQKYPYDAISNDDMDVLANFSSDDLWKWEVHGDEYDPRRKHEAAELMKYMPFLRGVAPEGKSWLDGQQDMKLEAQKNGFSYDQEGLGKFLNKLSKYQGVYDRAQLMKELRSQPWYWPTRIAYPSMMEGAENAISTGGDITPAQLLGLGGLDAATNVAMFGFPGNSARFLKTGPILSGSVDAAAQGALELNRQGAKTLIDPTLEADPTQAIAAAMFGASRPGIVGSLQAGVAKIPGKEAMAISRGIGKSSRAGNPVANEGEAIKDLVRGHNEIVDGLIENLQKKGGKFVFKNGKVYSTIPAGGTLDDMAVSKTETLLASKKVKEMADVLGVKPDRFGRYNVDEFMKAYDKKPVYAWSTKGLSAKISTPSKDYKSAEKIFQLTPANVQQYKSLFPAKYADEAQASRLRTFGLGVGKVAGDFGGRFEPTFKLNPLNIGPQTTQNYNEQDWYTRLGPKARAIIDEAFKKKLEEEEEKANLDEAMGL